MDRVVVADDHPLFRAAIAAALMRAAPGASVEETSSLAGAREALSRGVVDLLLLDLKLTDSEGFSGLVELRGQFPAVPIVVVSASEDGATVRRVRAFGAAGFIPKSATLEEMAAGLSAVRAGDSWFPPLGEDAVDPMVERIASLTPSQLKILIGLQQGRLNKQIAFDLGVTEATIKAHLTSVFRKLGVQNRTQAVIAAQSLALEP